MLMTVINHPWLLEHHSEEFSALEFLNPDADQLRRAILDAATDGDAAGADTETLRAAVSAQGARRRAFAGGDRHHPPLGLAGEKRRQS